MYNGDLRKSYSSCAFSDDLLSSVVADIDARKALTLSEQEVVWGNAL